MAKKCDKNKLRKEFMKKRFPKEPKNSSYAEEWKDRFNTYHVERYMDSESLKVYKKLKKKHKC